MARTVRRVLIVEDDRALRAVLAWRARTSGADLSAEVAAALSATSNLEALVAERVAAPRSAK